MSESTSASLEAELRADATGWTDDYLVRLYPDTRSGLRLQSSEAGILAQHGYVVQSSELAREGSLMVAYVREDEAELFRPLAHPGLSAATDPDSMGARLARPLVWVIVLVVIGFAFWLLLEALA